jgi:CheY-like chemotaxis protein/nitrogen-specific signal transduction histidine kinase
MAGQAAIALESARLYRSMEQEVQQRTRELELALVRAEESTRAKGKFLANMSHEIRTPMNAVIGLSALALKIEMPPRVHDYLRKIQQSGKHLLGIINDILDFSKIESGKLEIETVPFSLDAVIDNVVNLIAEKVKDKGLVLLCHIDPEIPKTLLGDPLRLGQILINLANNAVKFTRTGEVRIRVRIDSMQDQQVLLHFSVADTGIGLTQEQMARLFRSFEQADTSTTREFGGTGLGLAISKSLVLAMGGTVGVDSVFEQGSTFWFTTRLRISSADELPGGAALGPNGRSVLASDGSLSGPVPRPAHDAMEQQLSPIRGARILLVEDNEINQLVACEMLRGEGFEVEVAQNGQLAVVQVHAQAARQRPYDIVLMDMQMPVMDGVSAARLIRQRYTVQELPIVAMTANAMEDDRDRCLQAGMNGFVTKPVNADELWQTLLQWIKRRAGLGGPLRPTPVGATDATAGAQAAYCVLLDALRAIPDLNVGMGLLRTTNKPDFYVSLLRKFVSSQADAVPRMRQSLALADPSTAERLAHTLKGLAGNLGAMRLFDSAQALEKVLCSGSEALVREPALAATDALLQRLVQALRATPGFALVPWVAPYADLSAQERQTAQQAVEEIKTCLANNDANALELWEIHTGILRPLFGQWALIEAAIGAYEFETAMQLLNQDAA